VFYQLLNYKDDEDLVDKLEVWENFYNFHRPHGAFDGRTSYEILRERLVPPEKSIALNLLTNFGDA
jgi:transposase InsO family protein